jgi:hypothetical protein
MSGVTSLSTDACVVFNNYQQEVEASMRDGLVTGHERAKCERKARRVALALKNTDVAQQLGIRLVRTGRADKNLLTLVRALCVEQADLESVYAGEEKAASERELVAAGLRTAA